MLIWHRRLQLIDHGAALYFHHAGRRLSGSAAAEPFRDDHAITCCCRSPSALREADARACPRGSPPTSIRADRRAHPGRLARGAIRRSAAPADARRVCALPAARGWRPRALSSRRRIRARSPSSYDYAVDPRRAARRARGVRQRRRDRVLPGAGLPRRADRARRARAAGARSRASTWRADPRAPRQRSRWSAPAAPRPGPIGRLPLRERFHWLVAPRSTIIQTSPVHTGRCEDPAAALEHLVRDDGADPARRAGTRALEPWLLLQRAVDELHADRALADRRRDALDAAGAHVADREDARAGSSPAGTASARSGQRAAARSSARRSAPVRTKPLSSSATQPSSHCVFGAAPVIRNTCPMSRVPARPARACATSPARAARCPPAP